MQAIAWVITCADAEVQGIAIGGRLSFGAVQKMLHTVNSEEDDLGDPVRRHAAQPSWEILQVTKIMMCEFVGNRERQGRIARTVLHQPTGDIDESSRRGESGHIAQPYDDDLAPLRCRSPCLESICDTIGPLGTLHEEGLGDLRVQPVAELELGM